MEVDKLKELIDYYSRVIVEDAKIPENLFEGVTFPLIKQVHSKLIARELVAVQPLSSPFENKQIKKNQEKKKFEEFYNNEGID
jgi:hypothetical protein